MKKITFEEMAQAIASDHTLEYIPDIIWPNDCRFHNSKIAWLAGQLEAAYIASITELLPDTSLSLDTLDPDE